MTLSKKKQVFIHYFPMFGCICTGIIYGAIGIIALLSFMQIKEGGADESSLLVFLDDYLAGKILVGLILLGTVSFIIWRLFESYTDPYKYGDGWIGYGRRTGIALSSMADAFIAYSAFRVLFGTTGIREDGNPEEEREMVTAVLDMAMGDVLITLFGGVILLTAIVQFYYGVTSGYRERLDIAHFRAWKKRLIHWIADIGYFARGIIIGIIGFFYIKAGLEQDAGRVVNTDKAFDFLGDTWSPLFILVALGTISYAVFMITQAITYDVDNEEELEDSSPA
ncbi:DUF1206 domain-containing protein [Anditalea andensis]|uniref:DUF1206 domain-containing protein n=1 Tax=Anditalea andensis TaxID=1048983 RepID=A0A074L4U2_9BACT|nr:DUF1206 domain-containing protein [Anditalea andensis]KEO75505.1 hypothetical protein EL17_01260 [Anditalea andensis]